MDLNDLETIKAEFEAINKIYRQTFSFQGRMELIERVKKLVAAITAGAATAGAANELEKSERHDVRRDSLSRLRIAQ